MEIFKPTPKLKASCAAFLLLAGGLVAEPSAPSAEISPQPASETWDQIPPIIEGHAIEGDEVVVPQAPDLAQKKK